VEKSSRGSSEEGRKIRVVAGPKETVPGAKPLKESHTFVRPHGPKPELATLLGQGAPLRVLKTLAGRTGESRPSLFRRRRLRSREEIHKARTAGRKGSKGCIRISREKTPEDRCSALGNSKPSCTLRGGEE